jgi:hypothetical protein
MSCLIAAISLCSISCFGGDALCPNDEEPANPKHPAVSFTAEYDSKYIFRGMNSLPGSGIATTDTELDYQHFWLELWQATGISKSYDEFDFTFGYKYERDPFIISAGYINYYHAKRRSSAARLQRYAGNFRVDRVRHRLPVHGNAEVQL